MIKPEQIPDEVHEEFDRAFVIEGKPFKLAFAAALNAWPRMAPTEYSTPPHHLILPLPKEGADE